MPMGLHSLHDKLQAIPDIAIGTEFVEDSTKLVYQVVVIRGQSVTCQTSNLGGSNRLFMKKEFTLKQIKIFLKYYAIVREGQTVAGHDNYHIHCFTCFKNWLYA